MLKNYLKIGLRNLLGQKDYSFINISSLTMGIATVLLATIYLSFEHSYDKFYKDKISRLVVKYSSQDRPARHMGNLPYDFGQEVLDKVPEIEDVLRLKGSNLTSVVEVKQQSERYFNEDGLVFADVNYFDFFGIDLLAGTTNNFSKNTRGVVLSQSAVLKYFGQEDPIGQLVEVKNQKLLLEVVGVMPDYSSNSSIQFDMVASVEALRSLPNAENIFFNKANWTYQTFVKEREAGRNQDIALDKINSIPEKNHYQISPNQEFYLEPIADMHFESQTQEAFYAPKGDAQMLLWFSIIAAMVLVFAIINYSNVLTANALKRVKEIGIRKIIGARRGDVLIQMMLESLITTLISLVMASLIVELVLPFLGHFVQSDLLIGQVLGLNFYVISLLMALLIGMIAGIYPAIILSGINALNIKKAGVNFRRKKNLGGALVVFQFAASMVLISIALYMNRQLDYVINKDLGFSTENTLVVKNLITTPEKISLLQNELLKNPSIEKVAISDFIPGMRNFRASKTKVDFNDESGKKEIALLGIDEHFLDLYDIDILEDIDLDAKALFGNDSHFVLVNETTLKAFGTDDLIGSSFSGLFKGQEDYSIQGTIEDFHVASLHNEIMPFALIPVSGSYSGKHLSLRFVSGTNKQLLLSDIQKKFSEIMPELPFDLSFSLDSRALVYAEELRLKSLINALTLVSLILSFAGILGITLAIVGQRKKEISIRKVLGARLAHLLAIQNKHFFVLIIIAFVLASPLAYQGVGWWKNDFIYKVDFSVWSLMIPLLSILFCTFLVSGWLTLKTAIANPVDSLRYE